MCVEAGGCCFRQILSDELQVISVEYVRVNRAKTNSLPVYDGFCSVAIVSLCLPSPAISQRNPWFGFIKYPLDTPGAVFIASNYFKSIAQRRQTKMAVQEKISVKIRSYEHTLADQAAAKIVDIAKRNGAEVSGPIPLPTEKEIITILRAVHKYKDSREQFEQRTHKRLIQIKKPSQKVVEALMSVELPAGVDIDVKL